MMLFPCRYCAGPVRETEAVFSHGKYWHKICLDYVLGIIDRIPVEQGPQIMGIQTGRERVLGKTSPCIAGEEDKRQVATTVGFGVP